MKRDKKILMAEASDIYHDGRVLKEAGSLVRHGYNVNIIGFREGRRENKYKFQIFTMLIFSRKRRHLRNLSIAINTLVINLLILFIKSNIYHAHNTMFLFGMFFSSKLHNGKLIYDSHEVQWEISKLAGWIESKLINKVDHIINVSEGRALHQAKKYGIPKKNITLVHNYPELRGIEITLFKPVSTNNKLKFVFSGGFNLNDNRLDNFIRALKKFPELSFDVVGFGYGDSHQKLLDFIADNNMEEQVKVLPLVPVAQLILTLSKYDIAVNMLTNPNDLISYNYPAINKMYEYLAAGLPILCSNIRTFIDELVKEGAAISVDPFNTNSIYAGIEVLLEKYQDNNTMKMKARELASSKYNWETQENNILGLYQRLIK